MHVFNSLHMCGTIPKISPLSRVLQTDAITVSVSELLPVDGRLMDTERHTIDVEVETIKLVT